MIHNILCTGRTAGSAGRRNCEFIHCKQTPHSGACQKIQEWSCKVEGFDPASHLRQHKELKDLIQILQFLGYAGLLPPRLSCRGLWERQPSLTLTLGLQTIWIIAGMSEEKVTTGSKPGTLVMDLPRKARIENQSCYKACYILCYITHAIFNAM